MSSDYFFLLDSPEIFADRGTMFAIFLRVVTPLVTLPSLLDSLLHAMPPFGRHHSRAAEGRCVRLSEYYYDDGKPGNVELLLQQFIFDFLN